MIVGYVDRVECGWISGWAADTEHPNRSLDIGLVCNSRLLATGRADQPRNDVVAAGIGHGRYGFTLNIPAGIGVAVPEELQVVVLPEAVRLTGGVFICDTELDDLDRVATRLAGLIPAIPILTPPIAPKMGSIWAKLQTEAEGNPEGVAVSAGFAHYFACAQKGEFLATDQTKIEAVIEWLVNSRNLPSWIRLSLVPAATLLLLSEPVLNAPDTWGPISRFVYHNWLSVGGDHSSEWHTQTGWQDAILRFGLTPIMEASLPAALISQEALELLSRPEARVRADQVAWSALWALCHRSRPELESRVDPSRRLDRLTYASGTLIAQLIAGSDSRLHPDFMTRSWRAMALEISSQPSISRLEYVVARAFGPARLKELPGRSLATNEGARQWVEAFLGAARHDHSVDKASDPETGKLYLVGYHNSEAGLGRNVAMSLRAFAGLGIEVVVISPDGLSFGNPIPDGVQRRPLKRNIAFYHLNADAIPLAIMQLADRLPAECIQIGFCLWEVSTLPTEHRLALDILDEIWTPTRFVAEIYAQKFQRRIRVVGKGITAPQPNRKLHRSDFGLPDEAFVCCIVFDFDSSIERKNPLGSIRAFQRAWGDDPDVRCIVKVTNHRSDRWLDPYGTWALIVALAARDRRVIILDAYLPYPDLMRLIELSDVLVSLHRSEGFGYNIADAMALGRPVVVTDYSGTTDFCDAEKAWGVSYALKTVESGDFIFDAPGAVWADPDIEDAARCLRAIRENPSEARRRAENALAFIANHYCDEAQSQRYLANLSDLAATQ